MDMAALSQVFSAIGEIPVVALIAVVCMLCGIGIGIAVAFRDLPKYLYKTFAAILNFVLRLFGKEQIDLPPDHDEKDLEKILKMVQALKGKQKDNAGDNA